MSSRIILSANRVAVSRPGFDVLTALVSSASMAFDSSIPIERPLEVGLVIGKSVTSGYKVLYSQAYSAAPAVTIHPYEGGSIYDEQIRFLQQAGGPWQSGIKVWQSSYAVICGPDGFQFSAPGGGVADPWRDVARNWLYVVWRVL